MFLHSLLICFFLLNQSISNLIINGDFEDADIQYFFDFNVYLSSYLTSTNSVWYSINCALCRIEIKIFPQEYTTICAEPFADEPITLCQNVQVSIGSKYILSYSAYSSNFIQVNTTVYINNMFGSYVFIKKNHTFGTQIYNFYAPQQNISICFNQTHFNSANNRTYGALLDNISLLLVQSQLIIFNLSVNQLKANILFQSNLPFDQYQAGHFKSTYQAIYIEQTLMDFVISHSTEGNMQITISYNFTFKEDTIQFPSINQNINKTAFDISFASPLRNKYFHSLNSKQSSFLILSRDALIFTNRILAKVSTFSRVFFASYFISLIVDVHFLSLFYIFIQPQVMPEFSKQIYYQILDIIFSSQSSIQYIQRVLNISKNILKIKVQDSISEKIDSERNQEPWFGSYSVSSRILNCNIANILTIGLLIIKIQLVKLALKIIRKIVPESIKKDFKMRTKTETFLLRQFCFMTPILVISALANIISSSINFSQKIYNIFSINLMLFIIGCLVCYMCQDKNKAKKMKKIDSNNQKNGRDINKTKKYLPNKKMNKNSQCTDSQDSFLMPLLFFIPFGVFIGNAIFFFVINGLVMLMRLFTFFKIKIGKTTKFQNILNFLNILLWMIHHIVFIFLWSYKYKEMNVQKLKIVSFLGLMTVFTVLVIFFLQTMKLIVMTIKTVIKTLKFVYKLYKMNGSSLKEEKLNKKQKFGNEKEQKQFKIRDVEIVILGKENMITDGFQKDFQEHQTKIIKQKKVVIIENASEYEDMVDLKKKKKKIFTQFYGKPQPSPIIQIQKHL